MEQSTGGPTPKKPPDFQDLLPTPPASDQFFKNVLLLKNGDFQRIAGQVYMPTASEIAALKTTADLGQFKRRLKFFASMTEDMVKKQLEETFPYLKNRR